MEKIEKALLKLNAEIQMNIFKQIFKELELEDLFIVIETYKTDFIFDKNNDFVTISKGINVTIYKSNDVFWKKNELEPQHIILEHV